MQIARIPVFQRSNRQPSVNVSAPIPQPQGSSAPNEECNIDFEDETADRMPQLNNPNRMQPGSVFRGQRNLLGQFPEGSETIVEEAPYQINIIQPDRHRVSSVQVTQPRSRQNRQMDRTIANNGFLYDQSSMTLDWSYDSDTVGEELTGNQNLTQFLNRPNPFTNRYSIQNTSPSVLRTRQRPTFEIPRVFNRELEDQSQQSHQGDIDSQEEAKVNLDVTIHQIGLNPQPSLINQINFSRRRSVDSLSIDLAEVGDIDDGVIPRMRDSFDNLQIFDGEPRTQQLPMAGRIPHAIRRSEVVVPAFTQYRLFRPEQLSYTSFANESMTEEYTPQEVELNELFDCPVCYLDFQTGKKVYQLPCNHKLCITCFNGIKSHKYNKCPMCRARFTRI